MDLIVKIPQRIETLPELLIEIRQMGFFFFFLETADIVPHLSWVSTTSVGCAYSMSQKAGITL